MDAFLTMQANLRRQLCEAAGVAMGLNPAGIEKDFWVCWTLRELFTLPGTGPHLTFKGGTSLSKGWKLIERFSEDIDVVIDREFLGFGGERSPEAATGSNERKRRLDALKAASQKHIRESLAPAASLLHEETYRTGGNPPAARLARHYYDLWCLIRAGVADAALAEPELFNRVAAHRAVFFRRTREAQDALRQGSLRLLPAAERQQDWKRDYEAMRETMFFGDPPQFDKILEIVGEFERRFNALAAKSS